jgi:hypothetical protein
MAGFGVMSQIRGRSVKCELHFSLVAITGRKHVEMWFSLSNA